MKIRYHFNENGWWFTSHEFDYEPGWSRYTQYETPASGWFDVEYPAKYDCFIDDPDRSEEMNEATQLGKTSLF